MTPTPALSFILHLYFVGTNTPAYTPANLPPYYTYPTKELCLADATSPIWKPDLRATCSPATSSELATSRGEVSVDTSFTLHNKSLNNNPSGF